MNRSKQLWFLMALTSVTMVTPYALQGFLQHNDPSDVAALVWTVEAVSWGFRALVEVWAVIYLAQTVTKKWGQTVVVWSLKLTLIALIAATLGPVIATIGYDKHITKTTGDYFWLWAFGVAAYGPMMMAAAAVGYKIMPHGVEVAERIGALECALKDAQQARDTNAQRMKASAGTVAKLRGIAAQREIETERKIAALQAEIAQGRIIAEERAKALKMVKGGQNSTNAPAQSAPTIQKARRAKTQKRIKNEKRAAELFAQGKKPDEIAQIMNIKQVRTVRRYLANGTGQEEAAS